MVQPPHVLVQQHERLRNRVLPIHITRTQHPGATAMSVAERWLNGDRFVDPATACVECRVSSIRLAELST